MTDHSSYRIFTIATGPYGLVGRGLWKTFPGLVPVDIAAPPPDFPTPEISLSPVDITNGGALSTALAGVSAAAKGRPIVVFHLAALTDTRGDQTDLFEKVNVLGTENVLKACRAIGARMVHISTDYVFESGDKADGSYSEDDRPASVPKTAYSLSKYRAENLLLDTSKVGEAVVARIAFPYGMAGPRAGLAEKYLQKMKECRETGQPMKLFNDQRICPSYIPDIVRGLDLIAQKVTAGDCRQRVFHLVGEATTPYDFGKTVQRVFGFDDVKIESSSVQGTRYAANLGLSTLKTEQALGWRATPHEDALSKVRGMKS
jgi:dTDP-4-dehydrorhamnose reductase